MHVLLQLLQAQVEGPPRAAGRLGRRIVPGQPAHLGQGGARLVMLALHAGDRTAGQDSGSLGHGRPPGFAGHDGGEEDLLLLGQVGLDLLAESGHDPAQLTQLRGPRTVHLEDLVGQGAQARQFGAQEPMVAADDVVDQLRAGLLEPGRGAGILGRGQGLLEGRQHLLQVQPLLGHRLGEGPVPAAAVVQTQALQGPDQMGMLGHQAAQRDLDIVKVHLMLPSGCVQASSLPGRGRGDLDLDQDRACRRPEVRASSQGTNRSARKPAR